MRGLVEERERKGLTLCRWEDVDGSSNRRLPARKPLGLVGLERVVGDLGEGIVGVRPGGGLRRSSSSARCRAIWMIQLLNEPRVGSNVACFCQTVTKTSRTMSSAVAVSTKRTLTVKTSAAYQR